MHRLYTCVQASRPAWSRSVLWTSAAAAAGLMSVTTAWLTTSTWSSSKHSQVAYAEQQQQQQEEEMEEAVETIYKSQDRYRHPTRPHVGIATAATLDDIFKHQHQTQAQPTTTAVVASMSSAVASPSTSTATATSPSPLSPSSVPAVASSNKSSILLQVYAPWCNACKQLQPVVDGLALVLHEYEQNRYEDLLALQLKHNAPHAAAADATAADADADDGSAQVAHSVEDALQRALQQVSVYGDRSGAGVAAAGGQPLPTLEQAVRQGAFSPTVSIYVMNGDTNHKKNFIPYAELQSLPLLKFFPYCDVRYRQEAVCQPVTYREQPSVEALINFLHQTLSQIPRAYTLSVEEERQEKEKTQHSQTAQGDAHAPATTFSSLTQQSLESAYPFDLEAMHGLGQLHAAQTNRNIFAAGVQRFEKEVASSPSFQVSHRLEPCGDKLGRVFQHVLTRNFLSYRKKEEDDEKMNVLGEEYRKCREEKKNDIKDFWKDIAKTATERVNTIKEEEEEEAKEKQAQQAQSTDNAETKKE